MCWKGVGAVSHRGMIVSTAQSSWLPSSCAWPVSLGSLRHGGMCVCLGGYLYRRMPPIWGWTAVLSTRFRVFLYFRWEFGEKLDHFDLALSSFCIASSDLGVIDSVLGSDTYFEKQNRRKGLCCLPQCLYYYISNIFFYIVKAFI